MAAPRKTETTPVQRSSFREHGLRTTAIRFDDSVGSAVGVGMEFATPADFGATSPLSDNDEAVLAGIAERLGAHGKTERFGVRLVRNPLDLSEHELLHETCYTARRMLQCDVGERDALLADRAVVQTAWRWKIVQGKGEPAVMQDCTASCVSAGEGHDITHTHVDNPDPGV